jgi:hypothetical protein
MEFKKSATAMGVLLASTMMLTACGGGSSHSSKSSESYNFNRIATFPVCKQIQASCDTDTETVAEIVTASKDGMTLIYTDSPGNKIGFVDITNPDSPAGLGTLEVGGEPTSVSVKGDYALVGVNTSTDYVNVSGKLVVVDIATRSIVTSLTLAGQPDSVAVSPDGNYAAVAIENERDEDLNDGALPQLPAGTLNVVDTSDENPANWAVSAVDVTGLSGMLYNTDPEPEFVDINSDNIVALTLQENNHVILVDLETGTITSDFSAGTVDLEKVDATEEDPALIMQTETLTDVPREPDGVTWIGTEYLVTANEGDLDGGSRGFSVFDTAGNLVYDSASDLDHLVARIGQYPDGRSGNKGNEPENVEYGVFDGTPLLFVNSERSSVVFVYDMTDPTAPVYKQVLPTALAPEGALAIPSRNLLVAASEKDDRGDKVRGGLNIYQYQDAAAQYPTLESVDRSNGTPIPWSAMSGLSSDAEDDDLLYAVEDSFYQQSRIFTIDTSSQPAKLIEETRIMDSNNVLASVPTVSLVDASVDDDDATRVSVFDEADLAAMINGDKSVNLDPEGVAKVSDGFWVVSEGSGTMGDAGRPINTLNLLIKTDNDGVIEKVVTLPDTVNAMQLRFGFEGVTQYGDDVYVAFQRAWGGEPNVRIGIYDTVAESWSFLFYPLDAAESQNGGWVGLSDITSLGNGEFLVVERDNQGGPDAAIKRLYRFDVTGLAENAVVSKTLVRDLMPDLAAQGGLTPEKIEGLAVMNNGDVLIINDNDGVDDNSGETQLLNLGGSLLP